MFARGRYEGATVKSTDAEQLKVISAVIQDPPDAGENRGAKEGRWIRPMPSGVSGAGGSGYSVSDALAGAEKTQSMVEGALVEEESKTAGAARDAAEGAR